jgi:hypothetical protein
MTAEMPLVCAPLRVSCIGRPQFEHGCGPQDRPVKGGCVSRKSMTHLISALIQTIDWNSNTRLRLPQVRNKEFSGPKRPTAVKALGDSARLPHQSARSDSRGSSVPVAELPRLRGRLLTSHILRGRRRERMRLVRITGISKDTRGRGMSPSDI